MKPRPAEVILSELMASDYALGFGWLARCTRTGGSATSEALKALASANIIHEPYGHGTGYWHMTDEGRALIRQRPPYNCYQAILDELSASGPLTGEELESACHRQACDYTPAVFMLALYTMLHDDLVMDMTERGDANSTYDLPGASE